ncbi:MAG: hypothetical protein AABY00_00980 [Nanoarchaeota archaeon]
MKKRVAGSSRSNENSFGTASVVLGIVSLVFPSYYGLIPGIVALVFALKQRHNGNNRWAVWGCALAIIGILINVLDLMYGGAQGGTIAQYLKGYTAS